ncbi:hypothetical protein J9B83_03160 [Marinomonas sp. A79]|uniref:YhhN-like protein n=1 Tax=Marinomonas vulgaris TaxID=2823372 RepID=A0ABS5H9B0_9GAMM|nr:hypothetical protein [Marinomonas vulgaris]MBR7887929.1 hypothetical protein [Marinomonas vulgaris]
MMFSLSYGRVYLPVFFVLWLGLLLDSDTMAMRIEQGQSITNGLVLACFVWVYWQVSHRIKKLMLYGVGLAYLGEVVFALWLGMYEYRLGNVPFYVPLGHSLVYAAVFYLHKERCVQKYKKPLTTILYGVMVVYSSLWLWLDQDRFGFLCTLVILLLLRKKTGYELFFLIMFFMVVYLELLGTYFGSWTWPDTWFATVSFITSSNPPSGISMFYFGFDIGCLWLYKQFNKPQWHRMKRLRALKRAV